MSVFYDLSKTPRNILNRAIVRAIVSESNGALFDPSDLSTLYQDAAGTTPVTAVEQPVGKILDKSGNGNHATQSITASRPRLSARYNLLTKTEDFSDAVWAKSSCTISSNVAQAPNGTISADKMVISSGTWEAAQVANIASVGGSIPVIAKVTMKAGEKSIGYIQCNSEGGSVASTCAMFNLSTGTKGSLITIAGAGLINPIAGITPLSNGFYECSLSFTTNATAGRVYVLPGFCDSMSSRSVVGDGVGGAYIFSADLRLGTTSGPYQRVNTATDYDTDERYFKKYLRFDGVDDYLSLPYMGLYANGSASVVAAIAVSPSTWSAVLAEGTSGMSQLYMLLRHTGTNTLGTLIINDNAEQIQNIATPITPAATTVCSIIDTGSTITELISGTLVASTPYTRNGTLTPAVTLVGSRPHLLDMLNGNLYGLIVTKSAITDAQRIACERHLSRKAGVAL